MKSLVKIGSLAAALVALGSASEAHAYVREQSNWNPNALPITYYINQATIPSTLGTDAGIAALDGGFASWSAPSCTTWRTTDAGNTTTSANTNDRRNVQLWISGSWPAELGSVNSVIGVTTPVWSLGRLLHRRGHPLQQRRLPLDHDGLGRQRRRAVDRDPRRGALPGARSLGVGDRRDVRVVLGRPQAHAHE